MLDPVEKGRAAMSKLLINITLLYSKYDIDFRNLVDGYELGAGKHQCGKTDFVLAQPP